MNQHVRAIVVDDEPRGLKAIERLLQLNCPEVDVIASCRNAAEAEMAIGRLRPELIFMDIAMPGKSGVEMLNDLKDHSAEVIFVTAHNHYMIQAFHLSAVDYLLKPIDDDLLVSAVKRACVRIQDKLSHERLDTLLYNIHHSGSPYKMKLCIPSLEGIQVVNIMDIITCEAKSNYTHISFQNKASFCSSRPIHLYEDLLENNGFVRVHRSYLVNLAHIREYRRGEGGSLIMSDGSEVEVSRRRKDQLLDKMKKYFK